MPGLRHMPAGCTHGSKIRILFTGIADFSFSLPGGKDGKTCTRKEGTLMKKLISLVLALVMLVSIASPALADNAQQTRVFVDSTGREVILPAEINRIAVTGALGELIVFAIAGDMLVGLHDPWTDVEKQYIPDEYHNLPIIGQLYGGKGNMSYEELLKADPQVVIDVGEPLDGIAADMDALTAQLGIPFVHVSAYLDSMDKTYTMLGELLGCEAEGKVLAEYCARVYNRAISMMENVEKVNLLYITGEKGMNVLAHGSFHSTVLDTMANNVAVVENPLAKGTGNEVDMEQILIWDPDVIIFSDNSVYDIVGDDPMWQSLTAIQTGKYYEIPFAPHNWISMPPSVQRLLGLMWMGTLFYPEAADYDLYAEVVEYYKLFYHCELTEEMYNVLVERSINK